MNDADLLKFTLKVLELFSLTNSDDYQNLFWRTDGQYAPVSFWVNCSDVFVWGGADLEPIETFEDLELFQRCHKRSLDAGDHYGAGVLYCCTKRKMRPQGAWYAEYKENFWPLLDECGPPREVGLGNPKRRPGDG